MRPMISTLPLVAALAACGGGGNATDRADPAPDVSVSDAQVMADLKSSNIDFLPTNRPAGTWHWPSTPAQHIPVLVTPPTAGNATEQDYAAKTQTAITTINRRLTGLLVLDAVTVAPASGNYIHVTYGTSYVPPGSSDYQSYCANVATAPGVGNPIQPGSDNGIASRPVHVNLGNGHCDVTQAIVTHEFGHALGLATHFAGFGNDGPESAFWDVLSTLYANPAGTPAGNVLIRRAAR